MAITPPEASVVESLIDQHWLNQTDSHRPHLGGSQIGKECERALWYSFRWAFNSSFPGRIRRLFRRGHHEENWFVDDLKSIGVQVLERDPVTGKQFLYSDVGGHVGGSAGIQDPCRKVVFRYEEKRRSIIKACPLCPDTVIYALAEF